MSSFSPTAVHPIDLHLCSPIDSGSQKNMRDGQGVGTNCFTMGNHLTGLHEKETGQQEKEWLGNCLIALSANCIVHRVCHTTRTGRSAKSDVSVRLVGTVRLVPICKLCN